MFLKEKWRLKGIKDISNWTNFNFFVLTKKKAHKDKDICTTNLLSIIFTSLNQNINSKKREKRGNWAN